jgi:tetratricopeptide (TPR) repeat protein
MLAVQERYGEAFALAGLDPPTGDHTRWYRQVAAELSGNSQLDRRYDLALQVASTLFGLGEKDAALSYLDILSQAVEHDRSGTRLHELLKTEMRLGLWERALRHSAILLNKPRHPDPLPTLLASHPDTARMWWSYFREHKRVPRESLLEISRLLGVPAAGPLSSEELQSYLSAAEAFAAAADPDAQTQWQVALAETCLIHGLRSEAEAYLEKASAADPEAAIRLGDLYSADQDWARAAQWYRRAAEADPADSVALYLEGHAREKAGQHREGQALMERAHLLPLADSAARRRLAAGLKQRGLAEAALQQWQLVLRSAGFLVALNGRFRDTSVVDAAQHVGNALADDPLGRTRYWEMMHLSCLEAQLWIPTFRGYFRTPHIMHQTRAVAFLDQELPEPALAEIRQAEKYLPANTEFAEQIVPRLEAAGQQAEADRVFDQYFQTVQQICDAFPGSALHHNNLAWMSARCNRQLDAALQHVQRALELVPDSAPYLDTLGEVHYRRGDIEQAIDCAKRCLELDPHNTFYQQQLERFQQGQPAM